MPVGAATVRVRRLDLENAPRIARLVVDEAVQRGVHQRVSLGHQGDVDAVDDLVFRVQGAESTAQFDLQGVALDDRPLAADILRLLTARLLQPQLVRRAVGVEAENRAHIRTAHALGAEGEPLIMALPLRCASLLEPVHVEHACCLRGHVDGRPSHCTSSSSASNAASCTVFNVSNNALDAVRASSAMSSCPSSMARSVT